MQRKKRQTQVSKHSQDEQYRNYRNELDSLMAILSLYVQIEKWFKNWMRRSKKIVKAHLLKVCTTLGPFFGYWGEMIRQGSTQRGWLNSPVVPKRWDLHMNEEYICIDLYGVKREIFSCCLGNGPESLDRRDIWERRLCQKGWKILWWRTERKSRCFRLDGKGDMGNAHS